MDYKKRILPHPSDEMTPIERSKAIASGKSYDRIPVATFSGELSIKLTGCSMSDYWNSPNLMVETEIASFERFGHDGVGLGPNSYGIAEALGANVVFPRDRNPFIESPLITDYSILDSIKPIDPYKDARLPLFIQACEMLTEAARDVVGVGCSIGGPLTIASYLRGTDNLLRDMYKNPEQLHNLLKLVTENYKICIDALSVYGVGFALADPVASGTLISPKAFHKFVKPYLEEIMDYVFMKTGSKPSFHICGDSYKLWDTISNFNISVFSLDNKMDLELAKNEIGHKVSLMGNVDPVEVIMFGSKDDIFDGVRESVRKGIDTPKGYSLSPGCSLSLKTPIENVDYFMDAARIFAKKA